MHRPWGSYTVLEEGPGYKVKRVTVHAGGRLSLQLHHKRSEHWVVIAGTARVTRGEEVFDLHVGKARPFRSRRNTAWKILVRTPCTSSKFRMVPISEKTTSSVSKMITGAQLEHKTEEH